MRILLPFLVYGKEAGDGVTQRGIVEIMVLSKPFNIPRNISDIRGGGQHNV
jgi:hypothetical protein